MNERIKKIRKDQQLTQEAFGNRIGITKSSVSLLESGKNSPSEQTQKLICAEFNVNEIWLLYGTGEPYVQLQTNSIIAKAASILGQKDPFFEAIVDVYSRLNDTDKKIIIKLMDDLVTRYNNEKHPE